MPLETYFCVDTVCDKTAETGTLSLFLSLTCIYPPVKTAFLSALLSKKLNYSGKRYLASYYYLNPPGHQRFKWFWRKRISKAEWGHTKGFMFTWEKLTI